MFSLFIIHFIIIYVIFFLILFYAFYCNKTVNKKHLLLIAIVSCNRFIYLNKTMYKLIEHLKKYEQPTFYNIVHFDQGTKQRYYFTKKYKILNSFFMNPCKYSSSFNIIFSYLYTKYIFLLEEDWAVINEIEKEIFYPSFIKESILILEYYKSVYGILLRDIRDINVNYSVTIHTNMGKHLLHVLSNMQNRYSFTNGACIYRCSDLLNVKIYTSEYEVSRFFKTRNYKQ